MSGARRLGSAAEDQAAEFLLSKGYTLLGRRIKVTGGELDIVALDRDELVFVEVKSGRTEKVAERLDQQKANRIFAAAESFALLHQMSNHRMRFDLVVVVPGRILHTKDALRP